MRRISKRCAAALIAAGVWGAIGVPAAAQAPGENSPRAGPAPYPLQPGTMPARPQHVPPAALTAATKAAKPPPSEAQKQADAKAQADKQKQELAAAMERVAERWRERAQAQGWATHPAMPVAGAEASGQQARASGQPSGQSGDGAREAPMRSEKPGTAPSGEDVKQTPPTEAVQPAAPAASR